VNTNYLFSNVLFAPDLTAASSGLVWGFAAGGGVEYAFTNYVTGKFEYLYIGLPDSRAVQTDGTPTEFRSSAQVGRAGLNYKF
jgi:outer membrane immunogenic protein